MRELYPNKDIWCYTGCTLERDLLKEGAYRCEATDELLSLIDILVDGEFIEELKDLNLVSEAPPTKDNRHEQNKGKRRHSIVG